MRWQLRECELRRFELEEARDCLRGKHVLFAGDSISRNLYLNLASLVMDGWPEPKTIHLKDHEPLSSEHGHEHCDCFIPSTTAHPRDVPVKHNRFFSLPTHDLLLSYIQVRGDYPIVGRLPRACRKSETGEGACSLANMTRAAIAKDIAELKEEAEIQEAETDANFFDWKGSVEYVFANILPHMQVDVVVFNSGLWSGGLTDQAEVDAMFAACRESVIQRGGECIWRTTTKRLDHSAPNCTKQDTAFLWIDDTVPLQSAAHYGWGVFDAAGMTEGLERDAYWDTTAHFFAWVDQEVNNVLLNRLCPGP